MLELCLLGCGGMMPQTDIIDGKIQWKQYFNRLWRGNTGGDQGKRLEF